ncbi:MAG: hypothetical protein AMXMBFR82_41730 [Candidatus Hydrogenedentota bacterium]
MRGIFALAFGLILASAAHAQGTVTVSVDRDTVVQGEVFRITVQASGERIGEPELPEIEGLQIDPDPVYRSLQTSIVNGQMSANKLRGYNAVALQAGTVTIPPIGVQIADQIVLSQPVTLTVLPERHGASNRRGGGSGGAISLEDVLQLTVDLEKREAYQGEPILVTFTLWAMGGSQVRQIESEFPDTTGFYAIPREPEQMDRGVDTVRDGRQFTAVHWEQTIYPTKTGELEIGPWIWHGVLVPPNTMRARNMDLITDPVRISVKPLPEPPAGFVGAVGQFDVSVRKPSANPIRGVPFDLAVTISGNGNPDGIQAPPLPEVEWAYIAEPRREPGRDPRNGRERVERTFVYSITPMEEGAREMPGIEFCYFDPELEDYTVAKTDSLEWMIRPSTEPDPKIVVDGGAMQDSGVEVLGKDILPIITNPGPLRRRTALVWVVPPAVVIPALAYGGLALFVRHRRRLAGDTGFARAHRATRLAQRRLAGIHELPDPVDGLYRALVGYIADVFNVQESGLTSADIDVLLKGRQVDAETAGSMIRILKTCERARYGSTPLSDDELNALVHGALHGMERLDTARANGGMG